MSVCIYPNLAAELARNNMTRGALADKVGCTPTTLSLKLQGKNIFTLPECRTIRDVIDPARQMTLDYLFETTDTGPEQEE
jgi:transcriptional regulator with XRE-family HTH domain